MIAALLAAPLLAASAAAPLTLWHSYRGSEEQALEQAAALFTARTGTPVELLALPHDVFASKLGAAIPRGHGPDVFIFNHERLGSFAGQGLVEPSRPERGAYHRAALDALAYGGASYGFPLSFKCLALYVNTRLAPRPPKTTAELVALARSLSRPEENRFGLAYEAGNFYFHAPFLFGFGGELFDAAGRASFSGAGLSDSLAFVKKLQDDRLIPEEASGALVKSLFNGGQAAMVISGPWFAGEIAPEISYAVTPLPRVTETGLPLKPFLGVEAAFVAARAKRPDQAQALAEFLSRGEASLRRVIVGRQIPADLASYENPRVRADLFVSAFGAAARDGLAMPNTEEMSRVWEPMRLALRAVIQGGVAPEDAGALASRRYRALYRPAPKAAPLWPYAAAAALLLAWLLAAAARRWGGWTAALRGAESRRAYAYVAPAAAGFIALNVAPFAFGLALAFFHHEGGAYSFVGLGNFVEILASRGYRITEPLSFYFTFAVTVLWTLTNVALHVGVGLALALLLMHPLARLKGVFRVLLILPWAIPNYVTALIWKSLFHRQFGAINALLEALGLEPVSWFARFSTAFAANVAANTWLGFPFMMVVILGALQGIPSDLYEAARMDGASAWQRFRRITMPLLKPALGPAVALGVVWTFNMFNIIYLVSNGEPGGSTDILVSEAFRWAFERNQQYGFAAAYSALIFLALLAYSSLSRRLTEEKA